MYLGKKKCKMLKEIRQKIADENDIAYVTSECKHKGDCLGTCPKCEAELRYLEEQLELKRKAGQAVAVAAICATMVIPLAACTPTGSQPLSGDVEIVTTPIDEIENIKNEVTEEELEGDVEYIPPKEEEIELSGDVEYIPSEKGSDSELNEGVEPLAGVAEYISDEE